MKAKREATRDANYDLCMHEVRLLRAERQRDQALILKLLARVAELEQRIAELETEIKSKGKS